jgi:membrane associated rhomboid family serine protease
MFLHGGWDHILGNMLFLAIFGKNVVFYFAAMMTQTAMTLLFGTAAAARVPELGASGGHRRRAGRLFVLYPQSRIRTWIFPSSWSGSRPGSSSGCGSCTSSSRRASGCSAPRRTGAAWRSSPTPAGSSSACW